MKITHKLLIILLSISSNLFSEEKDEGIELLYQRLSDLEKELAELRSQLEENTVLMERSLELQQQRYLDLDSRILELSSNERVDTSENFKEEVVTEEIEKEKERREKERRKEQEAEERQSKGEGKGDKGKTKSRSVGNYTITSRDYSNLSRDIRHERQRLISRFSYEQGNWHKEITNRMDMFNETALNSLLKTAEVMQK